MATLKDGVIKRGKSWSYVIRITDPSGISKPRWVGGFSTEATAKEARDSARVAARRGLATVPANMHGEPFWAVLARWLALHSLGRKRRSVDFNTEIRDTII